MTSFETNARTGIELGSRLGTSTARDSFIVGSGAGQGTGGRVADQSSSVETGSVPLAAEGGSKSARISPSEKLAHELNAYNQLVAELGKTFTPAEGFPGRCKQAFEVANELFVNSPTWVCFYRSLMGAKGFIFSLFPGDEEFGAFLRTEEYHQIQLMLTALRSRDLPENDPNDPQRMITVRLPKSLHESLCEEATRLNISVNRLCISRMLQLLDPAMIPETPSKPRGRKPRVRSRSDRGNSGDPTPQ